MALNQTGTRPTQDVDAIAVAEGASARPRRVHVLPEPLAEAVRDVAAVLELDDDWLNVGVGAFVPPLEVDDVLPDAASHLYGDGSLRVTVASRVSLAKLKLYAAVDEGRGSAHELDLRRLALSPQDVDAVVQWYRDRFKERQDQGLADTIGRVWGEPDE